jgi:putative tryptophan/tyrosine transport system substrate-binding protein
MRRREFMAGLGAAVAPAAWALAARVQQPNLPVIGFLSFDAPEPSANFVAAFRKGLSETGFIEGRNVTIDYRFAKNEVDRLSELAADLVRRRVSVIAAASLGPALEAKAATSTIPIVFTTGSDPLQYGLVASFNRPGGNVTGINTFGFDLGPKQLQLLRDLLPGASRFAVLYTGVLTGRYTLPCTVSTPKPEEGARCENPEITQLRAAAAVIGRPIDFVTASTDRESDTAFASLVQQGIDALLVATTTLSLSRRVPLATLAAYHRIPAIYPWREHVDVGGLMSYGPNLSDQYRQAGIYTGRILKGEKPSDMPVMRPTKFEFIINLHTARTLGIEVPPQLLAITDEVID